MSGNDGELPDVIFPDDVFEERNLQRRLENALGLDRGDLSADDTMEAAIAYNTARQVQALFGGVELTPEIDVTVENINPQITLPDDVSFEVDMEEAVRNAHSSENLVDIFNNTVNESEHILSRPLRPQSQHSSYHITISPEDPVGLSASVNPDDDDEFDTYVSNGFLTDGYNGIMFSVSPDAEYNFTVEDNPSGTNIEHLRISEVFTDQTGLANGARPQA